jgi:alpha-D-xyloside xylohydrolase
MPVLRAMPLAFPDDPNTYDKDLQCMLGPWFLLAPIVARSGERTVYLPEGEWYEYWTGKVSRGPRTLKIRAPLASLPLYVRAGAIIPMMSPAHRIPSGFVDPLILEVYLADRSSYVFHEDEGDTRFHLRAVPTGYSLEWSGPAVRQMVFRVHRGSHRAGVDAGPSAGGKDAAVTVRRLDDNTTELRPLPARQGSLSITALPE